MRSYEHICAEINNEMEQEWKHLNNNLEFKTRGLFLCCHFPQQKYKFFDLTALTMSYEGVQFECLRSESTLKFRLAIPQFIEEVSWCP
jgi:transcription initiation factor IIE alpha subunit